MTKQNYITQNYLSSRKSVFILLNKFHCVKCSLKYIQVVLANHLDIFIFILMIAVECQLLKYHQLLVIER